MSSYDYRAWADRARTAAAHFEESFESRFGYVPDEQLVGGPTEQQLLEAALTGHPGRIPDQLVDFYKVCSEVSWPDVGNGYFVSPVAGVARGIEGAAPSRVRGSVDASVVCFGSDGGGGLFALDAGGEGPVYLLPAGQVRDQLYEDTMTPLQRYADDLGGFLDTLLAAVTSG